MARQLTWQSSCFLRLCWTVRPGVSSRTYFTSQDSFPDTCLLNSPLFSESHPRHRPWWHSALLFALELCFRPNEAILHSAVSPSSSPVRKPSLPVSLAKASLLIGSQPQDAGFVNFCFDNLEASFLFSSTPSRRGRGARALWVMSPGGRSQLHRLLRGWHSAGRRCELVAEMSSLELSWH